MHRIPGCRMVQRWRRTTRHNLGDRERRLLGDQHLRRRTIKVCIRGQACTVNHLDRRHITTRSHLGRHRLRRRSRTSGNITQVPADNTRHRIWHLPIRGTDKLELSRQRIGQHRVQCRTRAGVLIAQRERDRLARMGRRLVGHLIQRQRWAVTNQSLNRGTLGLRFIGLDTHRVLQVISHRDTRCIQLDQQRLRLPRGQITQGPSQHARRRGARHRTARLHRRIGRQCVRDCHTRQRRLTRVAIRDRVIQLFSRHNLLLTRGHRLRDRNRRIRHHMARESHVTTLASVIANTREVIELLAEGRGRTHFGLDRVLLAARAQGFNRPPYGCSTIG